MKISELEVTLNEILNDNIASIIFSPPGIGKSSLVHQVAAKKKWPVVDLRTSLLDPTDIRGIPFPDRESKKAVWYIPEFLPTEGEGIFFLDEFAQGSPAVMNSFFQFVWDRRVGDYVVPPGWRIVAASNRQSHRAGAGRLNTAMLSRFIHLDLDLDNDDWQLYAVKNNFHPAVRSFINFKKKYLWQFDANSDEPFPCPRTWEMVSKAMSFIKKGNLFSVVAGCVGKGVAAEYIAHMKMFESIPSINDILDHPDQVAIPTEASLLFAILGMISEHSGKLKGNDLEAVGKYVFRMPVEYATVGFRDIQASNSLFITVSEAKNWIRAHGKTLSMAASSSSI